MENQFKVDKEFIVQAHKEACPDCKEKLEEKFPDAFDKPEAKVDTWYKVDNMLFYTTEIHNEKGNHYGFVIENNEWKDKRMCNPRNPTCACNCIAFEERAVLASREEIEKALIGVAKKKGLAIGVRAELNHFNHGFINDYYYSILDNALYSEAYTRGGFVLFKDGEWARPIKESPEIKRIEEIEKELKELKSKLNETK